MRGYHGEAVTATAGTKRLSNLIRSLKWSVLQIDRYLLEKADEEVKKLRKQGKRVLCIWDGSVIEKPESEKREGLCPVVSSKAKRLHRSKKGVVFNPPLKKPMTVTGMYWTGMLITGMQGVVNVAMMCWWTTRGVYATKTQQQEEDLLRVCVRKWGDILTHVFDRGYSSGPWLQVLQSLRVKFVIRWKKGHLFLNAKGEEKKLWQIGQGKKYLGHKEIRDMDTGEKMLCDLWWAPIRHSQYAYQLYLVKFRIKTNIWYLVTNETMKREEQA